MKRLNPFRLILTVLAAVSAAGWPADAPVAGSKSSDGGYPPHQQEHRGALWLSAGAAELEICRHRSRLGNCFRLMRGAGIPSRGAIAIPVESESRFRQFTSELLLHADDLAICEISERWSTWIAAANPGDPPLEQRFCHPGPVSDAPACPCRITRETRRLSAPGLSHHPARR